MPPHRSDAGALGAWRVPEADYPATGSPPERWRFLLRYAVLAPSSHNAQPWRFRIRGDQVGLYADRTRSLPVVDPEDRELVMGCGAALFNLRVAARHFGHADETLDFPDPAERDLLATVRFGTRRSPSLEDDALFRAIPRRATNRQPFDRRPLAEEAVATLETAARREGAWLATVRGDEARHSVAALVAEGDRTQFARRAFRRELAEWIHPKRSLSHDGMPAHAFGVHQLLDLGSSSYAFVLRTFDIGAGVAARDKQLAEGSPTLCVLGTDEDTQASWLRAGEALERVLLAACVEAVDASFLNQPIEVPALRPRLAEVIGRSGFPHMLLRLGYGSPVAHTPRRPVNAVLR